MGLSKKKIWAVDFDGTLFGYKGKEKEAHWNMPLVNFLKERRMVGEYVILWTCRTNDALDAAVAKAKEEVGLEFDAVNDNLPFIAEKFAAQDRDAPRKVYANAYIDDKNCNDFDLLDRGMSLTQNF